MMFVFLAHSLCVVWSSLAASVLLQVALSHSFLCLVIFHCIYVPHLLYPFIWWCTFRLLPAPFLIDTCNGLSLLATWSSYYSVFVCFPMIPSWFTKNFQALGPQYNLIFAPISVVSLGGSLFIDTWPDSSVPLELWTDLLLGHFLNTSNVLFL